MILVSLSVSPVIYLLLVSLIGLLLHDLVLYICPLSVTSLPACSVFTAISYRMALYIMHVTIFGKPLAESKLYFHSPIPSLLKLFFLL